MDRCTAYAKRVVAGEIVAGELQILACKRHLKDLERQNTEGFMYYFDVDKANEVIEFAETLFIAEGQEKKQLKLKGFQDFIFGSLYGWRNSRGFRRFRVSYIEMARQQGKSLVNGINAGYIGNFSGYNYGQLYLAATKQDQAKIVFDEVVKFIEADDELAEYYEVKDYKSEIFCKLTKSTIRALSRDTKKIDGFRPIFGSVDEYHAHADNQMFKLLEGGTGFLDETLISIITTAGFNLNSPCYEQRVMCEKLLRGGFVNETMFALIFSMDKGDDIWDEKNWIKSNPLTCAEPKGIENMRDTALKAREIGGFELRDFMTKRLNTWVQKGDNQYVDVESFMQCASDRTLDDFRGQSCYVGMDLSSGGDLTTINLEFEFVVDGRYKFYFYSHSFMPRARLQEHIVSDIAPYDIWEQEGLITVTGGLGDFKNDYKYIVKHLKQLRDEYNINFLGIGYDPHNADGFLADLEELGCPLTMITQSARFLNDATVDLQLLIRNKDIEFDRKNALFIWSFINAKTTSNSFGEIKVDKEPNSRTQRIDPVDAAIDSHVLAMKKEVAIDVESEMRKYIERMGW